MFLRDQEIAEAVAGQLSQVGVKLQLQPTERAKIQVKEVRFIGNAHVPADDLVAVMQTRPGGYLAWISSAGTYKEEALQHDVQALQATYLDRGYVTVKIGRPAKGERR